MAFGNVQLLENVDRRLGAMAIDNDTTNLSEQGRDSSSWGPHSANGLEPYATEEVTFDSLPGCTSKFLPRI